MCLSFGQLFGEVVLELVGEPVALSGEFQVEAGELVVLGDELEPGSLELLLEGGDFPLVAFVVLFVGGELEPVLAEEGLPVHE